MARTDYVTGDSISASEMNGIGSEINEKLTPSQADFLYARHGQGQIGKVANLDTRILTNFKSGHGWTVSSAGGATVTLNDLAHPAFGKQSVKVVTGGTGASTILTSPALPAVDRASEMPAITVDVAEADKVARFRLMASADAAFTNYWTFESVFSSSGIPEVQRPFKHNEWARISFPWSTAQATGTPPNTGLIYWRILINDRATGPVTVYIGRQELIPAPNTIYPNGVCVITADDSFLSHATVLAPMLDEYGMRAVAFPIDEWVGQAGKISRDQLDELAFRKKWEIGGHASTYAAHSQSITGMTSAERISELSKIKADHQQRGYVSNAFAYPNGTIDAVSEIDLRKFFSIGRLALGRLSGGGADDQQIPVQPFRLYGQSLGNITDPQIFGEIDRAVVNKCLLVLLVHDIVENKVTSNDTTIAKCQATIDYLAASDIAVATFEDIRQKGLLYA
ncbi:minor tail protein [Gordonia phage Untouchable]|uniref:Minor tail protein n=1 Tax=Gordonia phage Untouchable TaxID=2656542 RepID=A0A649VAV9_9CAUD|nr:minor tail protein [Gordonia phage Untouchable]QGJ89072.1 minor tail protein [Gordonia phage Untouchable]